MKGLISLVYARDFQRIPLQGAYQFSAWSSLSVMKYFMEQFILYMHVFINFRGAARHLSLLCLYCLVPCLFPNLLLLLVTPWYNAALHTSSACVVCGVEYGRFWWFMTVFEGLTFQFLLIVVEFTSLVYFFVLFLLQVSNSWFFLISLVPSYFTHRGGAECWGRGGDDGGLVVAVPFAVPFFDFIFELDEATSAAVCPEVWFRPPVAQCQLVAWCPAVHALAIDQCIEYTCMLYLCIYVYC